MVECDTLEPLLATGYVFYVLHLLGAEEQQRALRFIVTKCAGVALLSSETSQ